MLASNVVRGGGSVVEVLDLFSSFLNEECCQAQAGLGDSAFLIPSRSNNPGFCPGPNFFPEKVRVIRVERST
jgi:hypothetical protein